MLRDWTLFLDGFLQKTLKRAHKSAFVCEGIECGFNIVKSCDELFGC